MITRYFILSFDYFFDLFTRATDGKNNESVLSGIFGKAWGKEEVDKRNKILWDKFMNK